MRPFERPDIFKPIKPSPKLAEILSNKNRSSLTKKEFNIKKKDRKKVAAYDRVVCCDGDEIHYIGLSKKGRFISFNHSIEELEADAAHACLGGQPCGCTRMYMKLRAVFDWLKFSPDDSDFVYTKKDRWKAIVITPKFNNISKKDEESDYEHKSFLYGFNRAFFEKLVRSVAVKYRRHIKALNKNNKLFVYVDSNPMISTSKAQPFDLYRSSIDLTPMQSKIINDITNVAWDAENNVVSDMTFLSPIPLSSAVSGISKRYRHLCFLLLKEKSTSLKEVNSNADLIYRYVF